jgi:NADH pyrophosphatase NudC (nudix superfamily)
MEMSSIKIGKNSEGKLMHYGVAAFIEKEGKYFLIKRATFPRGHSFIMGHVDEGEDSDDAIIREVKEESGFDVVEKKLIGEGELKDYSCNKGADCHYWKIYSCEVSGEMNSNEKEVESCDWFSSEEIKELDLEGTARYWFKKLGII